MVSITGKYLASDHDQKKRTDRALQVIQHDII